MTDHKYHVVEFRYPYQIPDAHNIEDAARKACAEFERQNGFVPTKWYTRIFVYETGPDNIGPTEEWFCNPQGTEFRKIDQNHKKHEEIIGEKNE